MRLTEVTFTVSIGKTYGFLPVSKFTASDVANYGLEVKDKKQ